jgi:hypothetical protein
VLTGSLISPWVRRTPECCHCSSFWHSTVSFAVPIMSVAVSVLNDELLSCLVDPMMDQLFSVVFL